MSPKSQAIVDFLANLMPLYDGERRDDAWCARSLSDGTLIFPVDEAGWDEERGTVRIWWQGDPQREIETDGNYIATLALERYVRLHGMGYTEESLAAELWFMANHFTHKTGCHIYLPQLPEPPSSLARAGRTALSMGQGILVNLLSKPLGA